MSRNQEKEDLDAFLTAVEAKMRGPYSSLDLAKVVTTNALRGSLTPKEYLHSISRVLSRTDKVIQLRILVGLLGLDPSKETDEEVYKILNQAQQSPLHEEWVRVISGLARGIMFVEEIEDGSQELKPCRGEEAAALLDKTCREILNQTRQLEKDTENAQVEEGEPSLQTADMYPLFVPYRYSLLNTEILDKVIPEHKENPHFQVNHDADILSMDKKIEKAKSEEAQDHNLTSAKQAVIPGATNQKAQAEEAKPEFPGFKPTKKVAPKVPGKSKASMFMPTKRPGMMPAGRGGRQMPIKSGLHNRKAGAAQSLLSKNRRGRGAATVGSSATAGRAQKFVNNTSKMKMIDVTEVQGLNQEHKHREVKMQKEETREQKMLAKKRKIMEDAAEKGLVAAPKIKKLEEQQKKMKVTKPSDNGDVGQQQQAQPGTMDNTNGAPPTAAAPPGGDSSNQEWQMILQERSNKLSDEDRVRVQQFFTDRYNPNPDQPVYKMKLHEERTQDPETGQPVKETYYLELDYNSFTSKQSKKIKRY